MLRSAILIASLLIANTAFSQPQPQAPQVKSPQQSESATKGKEIANDQEPQSAPPPIIHQPNPSNDLKDNTCDDCKKGNDEVDSEFWAVFGHRVKITDSLLAAFTGLLVVVTGGLIAIGVIQWLLSRDTARKELRAYMGVESIQVRELDSADPLRGVVTLANFGQTMAKDVEFWIAGAVEVVTHKEFSWGDRKLRTVAMPGERLNFEEPITIRNDGLTMMKMGAGNAILWGKITYTDVFGKYHWTIFRFVTYELEGNGWKTRASQEGNDAGDGEPPPPLTS